MCDSFAADLVPASNEERVYDRRKQLGVVPSRTSLVAEGSRDWGLHMWSPITRRTFLKRVSALAALPLATRLQLSSEPRLERLQSFTDRCPLCRSRDIDKIVYGLTVDEPRRGIRLAGCCWDLDNDPDYLCPHCGIAWGPKSGLFSAAWEPGEDLIWQARDESYSLVVDESIATRVPWHGGGHTRSSMRTRVEWKADGHSGYTRHG